MPVDVTVFDVEGKLNLFSKWKLNLAFKQLYLLILQWLTSSLFPDFQLSIVDNQEALLLAKMCLFFLHRLLFQINLPAFSSPQAYWVTYKLKIWVDGALIDAIYFKAPHSHTLISYCLFVVADWVLKDILLQIDETSTYTKRSKVVKNLFISHWDCLEWSS